jgi:hypothetical protein
MNYYTDLDARCKRLDITNIISNDIDAWEKNKIDKKIYNKLQLIESQNISCGPIGTMPDKYPIVIKPIINLYGMSRGFKIITNQEEYLNNQIDGSFWMPYLSGKNYTVDIIMNKGKILYYYCMESEPLIKGTFRYHVYRPKYKLSNKIISILEINHSKYTGPMNIEIINNTIIEGHLRLNGDLYLYDDNFLINLSKMINNLDFELVVSKNIFYLFPYFINRKFNTDIIDCKDIENILLTNKIKNIRWDNIESLYQRNDLSRLLMFKVNTLKLGLEIIEKIEKNFYLKSKIYNLILSNNGML